MATRETRFPNGISGFSRGSNANLRDESVTLNAGQCNDGRAHIFTGTGAITVTLPILTGVIGGQVTIVNGVEGRELTIDPNAADGIAFDGQLADGVTIVNTGATARKGDYVTLTTANADSTTGIANFWTVSEVNGVWAAGS